MKVRIIHPTKNKGVISVKSQKDTTGIPEAIQRFNGAFEQVKNLVLERSEEIDALKLCILINQHVMLEGRHGIAKSMLAEETFRRINDAKYFEIQLMKGTQSDQLFGPMNSEIYRKEARWEHNTEGFLPQAHFVFFDEVYRASDALLGSLMGMLNERKFHNGPKLMRCPLITAIGTTNFVTETDELIAFHDRWLVKARIQPIQARNVRHRMLSSFLARVQGEEDEMEMKTVSLDEIQALQGRLADVSVPAEVLELFEELCRTTAKNIGGSLYISDRRLCQTLNLVVAESMMRENWELKAEHLRVTKYGICQLNDPNQIQPFEAAYQTVVGTWEAFREEREYIKKTQLWVDKVLNFYDPSRDTKELEKLLLRARETVSVLKNIDGDDAPKQPENRDAYRKMEGQLESLVKEIEELPKMKKIAVATKKATTAAEKVRKQMALKEVKGDSDDEKEADQIEDYKY